MIRALEPKDVEELRKIHDKFFKYEFPFPDFLNGFLCCFVVTDDSTDDIILAGGVHSIAEVIAISDKSKDVVARKSALFQLYQAAAYVTKAYNYDQLHAFIQDSTWERRLMRHGFRHTKGHALVTDLG